MARRGQYVPPLLSHSPLCAFAPLREVFSFSFSFSISFSISFSRLEEQEREQEQEQGQGQGQGQGQEQRSLHCCAVFDLVDLGGAGDRQRELRRVVALIYGLS